MPQIEKIMFFLSLVHDKIYSFNRHTNLPLLQIKPGQIEQLLEGILHCLAVDYPTYYTATY